MVHSRSIAGDFKCTNCSDSFSSEIWQVINLTERSDLASQIIADVIHDITCPSCDTYIGVVAQPLLVVPATKPHRILLSPADAGSSEEQLGNAVKLLISVLQEIQVNDGNLDQVWMENNIFIVARAHLGANLLDEDIAHTSQFTRQAAQKILNSLNDSNVDKLFENDNILILRRALGRFEPNEMIGILALSVWNSFIPIDMLPVLDIKATRFEDYKASKLLVKMRDDESGVIGEYVLNPIVGALLERNASTDEIIAAHKLLAKYVQDDITDMDKSIAIVPIDFSLVKHVEGEPISPEAISVMECIMALRFIQLSVEQTENLRISRMVVAAAEKWHFHLLNSHQFHEAFSIATILYHPLVRWGRRDDAKELLQSTINRWIAIDPEKELWLSLRVLHEVFDSEEAYETLQLLFPSDAEEIAEQETIKEYYHKESKDLLSDGIKLADSEKYAEAIVPLRKAYKLFIEDGDEEGMFWSQYHIAETMFYLKMPVEAIEANGIARELALAFAGRPDLLADVLQLRGKIYSVNDFLDEAITCFNESIAIYEKAGRYLAASESKLLRAGVYLHAGQYTYVEKQAREVLEFAKQQKHTYLEWKSLSVLSAVYLLNGDDANRQLVVKALSLLESAKTDQQNLTI